MLRIEVVLDGVDSVAGEEIGECGADFTHQSVTLRNQGEHGGDDEQGGKKAEDRRVCCCPCERQHIVRERLQRGAPQLLEWTQHSLAVKGTAPARGEKALCGAMGWKGRCLVQG